MTRWHTSTHRTRVALAATALFGAGGWMLGGCSGTSQRTAVGSGARSSVKTEAGRKRTSAAVEALVRAGVGGETGATIGHMMDERAERIERDLKGATIERVGEGILITFDSGILFDVDEAELRTASREYVESLTQVLRRYDDTDILVVGHPDDTGPRGNDLQLSELRASAVARHAQIHGVAGERIRVAAERKTEPVASHEDPSGRPQHRLVEVAIEVAMFANGALREAASERASL